MLEVVRELHKGECYWCGKTYRGRKVFTLEDSRTKEQSEICVYCLAENIPENV